MSRLSEKATNKIYINRKRINRLEIWLTVTSESEHTVLAFIAAFNYPHNSTSYAVFLFVFGFSCSSMNSISFLSVISTNLLELVSIL